MARGLLSWPGRLCGILLLFLPFPFFSYFMHASFFYFPLYCLRSGDGGPRPLVSLAPIPQALSFLEHIPLNFHMFKSLPGAGTGGGCNADPAEHPEAHGLSFALYQALVSGGTCLASASLLGVTVVFHFFFFFVYEIGPPERTC